MRLFAPESAQEPAVDSLQRLASRGLAEDAGPRPFILRALTDLFVTRPVHTRDEIRQYEEIAHRLLNEASRADIEHAALALRHHPDAPREVLDRLASRGADVLLAECRRLSTSALQTAAASGPASAAAAVAQRGDLDSSTIRLLAARPELDVLRALAANDMAPLPNDLLPLLVVRARSDAALARALAMRLPHRPEILPLFLFAQPRQRRTMIARAIESVGPENALSHVLEHRNAAPLRRLEAIVAERARAELAAALADACECERASAEEMLADASGEALALALRAIGCDAAVAKGAFELAGHGVNAATLARLFDQTPQHAARHMLTAFAARPARARHVTQIDQSARESAGRSGGAVDTARRALNAAADRLQA